MRLRAGIPALLLAAVLTAAGCTPSELPTEPPLSPSATPGTQSGAPTPGGALPTPYSDPDAVHADYDGVIAAAQQAAEPGVGPVAWETDDPHLTATTVEGECVIQAAVEGEGSAPKEYDLETLLPNLNRALADHDFDQVDDFEYSGGWAVLHSTDSRGASFMFRAKSRVHIRVLVPAQCPE